MEAVIREQIAAHGPNSHSPGPIFDYCLGDGVELQIKKRASFPNGLLWSTLQDIVTGLWLYIIQGRRFRKAQFWVLGEAADFVIGYGVIKQQRRLATVIAKREVEKFSWSDSSSLAPGGIINSSLLDSRFPNSTSANPSGFSLPSLPAGPWRFRIPNTEMTLCISPRSPGFQLAVIEDLLNGANNRIHDQIELHGGSASIPGIDFRQRDHNSGWALEVINSRSRSDGLTWDQLADIVIGLAWFIVDGKHYRAFYFTVLYGEALVEIGFGRIMMSLVLPSHQGYGENVSGTA